MVVACIFYDPVQIIFYMLTCMVPLNLKECNDISSVITLICILSHQYLVTAVATSRKVFANLIVDGKQPTVSHFAYRIWSWKPNS